eukprot:c26564_g2_i2 orf=559-2487(-)
MKKAAVYFDFGESFVFAMPLNGKAKAAPCQPRKILHSSTRTGRDACVDALGLEQLQNGQGDHEEGKSRKRKHGRKEPSRKLGKKYETSRRSEDVAEKSACRSQISRKLDTETMQYFAEISSLLGEGGAVTDPEERAILCANALEETVGKELQLACDRSCSRVLESLFLSADAIHVASFLHRSSSDFPYIAMDSSGSHVAEAALKSSAVAVRNCDTGGVLYKTLKQALFVICQNMAKSAVDVMCSCYGSHVLRCLLAVCSGTVLESPSDNKRGLASRLVRLTSKAPAPQNVESKDTAFPDLLDFLVNRLLEECKESLVWLRMDPFAGPVLQTILKVRRGNDKAVTCLISILLEGDNGIAFEEGKYLEFVSNEEVMELMFNSNGSHLMEVILEVAPDALYMKMFESFFCHNILDLSIHPSANFVVQSLIMSARHQEQACQSLAHAIYPEAISSACLVPRMLFLENYVNGEDSKCWNTALGKEMSVLGCTILELIFSYPKECNKQFRSSLASMEANDTLKMVKDARGSHVIERFLSSSAPHKQKQRIVSRLKGNFAELSTNTFGSFTVEKCFSVAGSSLKEAIMSEIVAVQSDLLKTKHGPYLLKRFDVTGFVKSPVQWRRRLTSKHGTWKEFSEIFGTKLGSGI